MLKKIQIEIDLDYINDCEFIKSKILNNINRNQSFKIIKKSIDSRKKTPKYVLTVEIFDKEIKFERSYSFKYQDVSSKKRVIIIGAGPAGYFAALELIELGIKPIIIERGKDIKNRRKNIKDIYKQGLINPDSNYCFGEGGAGAYSDGKLFTRSTKRGDINKFLKQLVFFGASNEILIDSNPHIGSNKLPKIIANIRNTILSCGGEIHFNSKVNGFIIKNNVLKSVSIEDKDEVYADAVILACGHSARDIFNIFLKNKILIEPKPFALGVRIEHPQELIDKIQYHHFPRHKNLPAASYRLNCQVNGRGVYSFCMCPGGMIIPASTAPNELVLNGMSLHKRASSYANSGIVTEIRLDDIAQNYQKYGPLAFLKFQESIEKNIFNSISDGSQKAPGQRITDFIKGKISSSIPKSSYLPGIKSLRIDKLLPDFIASSLKSAFIEFDKKKRGFITDEAIVLAVESRTSSPIKIPRDSKTLMHPQIKNLFPCGEGAGYAGGISSSAMDGQVIAQTIFNLIN
ncbi:MAG: FAD-dependent oxidoreductase [Desulfobacterales bacterium]|nr:FAD-dependent oxidoreductase [Desulfobacterales bacterium]